MSSLGYNNTLLSKLLVICVSIVRLQCNRGGRCTFVCCHNTETDFWLEPHVILHKGPESWTTPGCKLIKYSNVIFPQRSNPYLLLLGGQRSQGSGTFHSKCRKETAVFYLNSEKPRLRFFSLCSRSSAVQTTLVINGSIEKLIFEAWGFTVKETQGGAWRRTNVVTSCAEKRRPKQAAA